MTARRSGISGFLAALALLALLALPQVAHAQTATVPDCSPNGPIMSDFMNNMNATVQQKVLAVHNFYSGIPQLDLKVNYCIDKLESMFDIAIGMGDVTHILGSIATNILTNLANQVCSAALQTVTSVEQFGLSQFNRLCVPLPNLNLNLSGLNLQGPACNGVNVLGIRTSAGGQALPPSVWEIWNTRP